MNEGTKYLVDVGAVCAVTLERGGPGLLGDNRGSIYLAVKPGKHSKTKRIKSNTILCAISLRDNVDLTNATSMKEGASGDDVFAQLKANESIDPLRLYKRYAIASDNHIVNTFGSGYYDPTELIDKSASTMEKMARAQIWAA
ncbi:hypothetical protein PInf_015962 [Phytophthora infestans]|nr:hypothetical protein PInf_015962 [Phytophthora infestans]